MNLRNKLFRQESFFVISKLKGFPARNQIDVQTDFSRISKIFRNETFVGKFELIVAEQHEFEYREILVMKVLSVVWATRMSIQETKSTKIQSNTPEHQG